MNLWDIYNSHIPQFIIQMASTAPLQRLLGVGMNCGCEYTKLHTSILKGPYSRFEHSVGAALIVWHFTQDVRMVASTLLHDVATPVFAHVVDFLNGDYMTQESTEEFTQEIIASSTELVSILASFGLEVSDVSDYHIFPLADNPTPRLSADRLEYTLSNAVNYSLASREEVALLYENLVVQENEFKEPELAFTSELPAITFARMALACSRIYASDADRYAMQILAELLADALNAKVIDRSNLYSTEAYVIDKIASDERLLAAWKAFCALEKVCKAAKGPLARNINCKRRYIDPLVVGKGRVSDLDANYKAQLTQFLQHSFDYWIAPAQCNYC